MPKPTPDWTWCERHDPEPCGECAGCLALAEMKADPYLYDSQAASDG